MAIVQTKQFNTSLASALFGGRGEAKIENLDSEKDFCVAMFQDGIYERRNTTVGSFVYKKSDLATPYLSTVGAPSFTYRLPKLPRGMLDSIVDFFREIMAEMNNSEVMVQVWWNKRLQEYRLYVPVQQVAGASIAFKHSLELQSNPDMIWVIDIHSHNNMSAFFSGTDSADEVSTRVFGVIGKLGQADFHSSWRAGVNGNFCALELGDLWDESNLDKTPWRVTEEDKAKVTRIVHTPHVMNAGSYFGGNQPGVRWINGNRPGTRIPVTTKRAQSKTSTTSVYLEYMKSLGFDTSDGPMDDIDLYNNFDAEISAITECLEELCVMDQIGEDSTGELNEASATVIGFLSERTGFSSKTCERIFDEISTHLSKDDFRNLINKYSE